MHNIIPNNIEVSQRHWEILWSKSHITAWEFTWEDLILYFKQVHTNGQSTKIVFLII